MFNALKEFAGAVYADCALLYKYLRNLSFPDLGKESADFMVSVVDDVKEIIGYFLSLFVFLSVLEFVYFHVAGDFWFPVTAALVAPLKGLWLILFILILTVLLIIARKVLILRVLILSLLFIVLLLGLIEGTMYVLYGKTLTTFFSDVMKTFGGIQSLVAYIALVCIFQFEGKTSSEAKEEQQAEAYESPVFVQHNYSNLNVSGGGTGSSNESFLSGDADGGD